MLAPRIERLTAGFVLAGLLAGCSHWHRSLDPGPLGEGMGEESGEICLPASDDGQYAFGHLVLRNPSEDDAVVIDVSLVEPKQVHLVESFVMEIAGDTLVGAQPWPPATVTNTRRWEERVRAAGATVHGGAADRNLVLHLSYDTLPASLKAVRVTYELDGDQYAFDSSYTLEIKDKCF